MNGLRPPLTSASVPAYVADKRPKALVTFALYSMVFLISSRIVLYRHRKSGHHLGTKASKIIVVLCVLICEKILILQGISQFKIFLESEFKYYFLYTAPSLPSKLS